MPILMKRAAIAGAALMLSLVSAHAQTMLADANGMTLYTFDKDVDGVSACYDDCAVKWPPALGAEGDTMAEGWTLVARTDGTMQWAYDGKPLYLFNGDTKAGDMTGDGVGDVWHIVSE